MREGLSHKHLLFGILAIINAGLLVYLGWQKIQRSADATTIETNLPPIEVIADTGKRLSLNSLTGKPLVVYFVDPRDSRQVDSISRVTSAFDISEAQFILITQNSQDVRRVLPELSQDVLVIQNMYAELRNAFKVPECCERRFVYDANGILNYHDYYYEADLTPRVNSLVKRKLPALSTAVVELLNSFQTGRFASFKEQTIHSSSGKGVVVLFTSVSSTCPSGELAALLGRTAKREGTEVLILLPHEYSASDLENFKTVFQIDFKVEHTEPELAKRWTNLVGVYGEPKTNGSVVFINRGEISVANDLREIERRLSQF